MRDAASNNGTKNFKEYPLFHIYLHISLSNLSSKRQVGETLNHFPSLAMVATTALRVSEEWLNGGL